MMNLENLVDRVRLIIVQPEKEWVKIKNEQIKQKDFLISYVLPLVMIPTIASFIGYGLIGMGSYFKVASLSWGLHQAILIFFGAFLGVFVSAFCIHKLATSFGTQVSFDNAVKLVAYSYTPVWLAGVFYILPSLSIISLLAGIYSLYILYVGFVPVTDVSEEKKTSYFIVSLILVIAVSVVVSLVIGAILLTAGLRTY